MIRRCRVLIVYIILAVSLTALSACGKRKPPIPPRERVSQRVQVSGFQRGNTVILSWKMPARNAEKDSLLNIDRADIYRLAEPLDSPLTLSEEEFANRSTLIAALKITEDDFGLKTLQYRDRLQFAGQSARLRYAIRLVNASGQKAPFSNFLLIEPTTRIAEAPAELVATTSQDAVTLTWRPADRYIDGTPVGPVLGYNVYRSTSEKEPARLLNTTPITGTTYADQFFEFGKDYFYFVRAVSAGTQAEPVESAESNILRLRPVDTFPPTAPTAITLAAGTNVISIFFAANPEKDIAGYRIYRSTNKEIELSKWEMVTPELLVRNTFQDSRVEAATEYFYYITAVDTAGNVSPPSDVVSETLR
jgi:predicted phage tail protein